MVDKEADIGGRDFIDDLDIDSSSEKSQKQEPTEPTPGVPEVQTVNTDLDSTVMIRDFTSFRGSDELTPEDPGLKDTIIDNAFVNAVDMEEAKEAKAISRR